MVNRVIRYAAVLTAAASVLGLAGLTASRADDVSARKILKSMSDYVASQKTISATFDSDIEVITDELQKIQFSNSGRVLLSRPDKIRVSRTGGYADVDLVFDGKTMSLLGKDENVYGQLDAEGSVDDLVARVRDAHSIAMPGADLILSNVYDELMGDVIDAKHIGQGVVDGVECQHLAFRGHDTDWQLWVQIGEQPVPRKYVITSKTMTGAPQYTLRIKEWRTDTPVAADAFKFVPPAGAKKVAASDLGSLDEVPMGMARGETK